MNGKFPETRLRRLRATEPFRRLVRETRFSSDQLIMPYFIQPGRRKKTAIASMPGQYRFSTDLLIKEIEGCRKTGIRAALLFGVPDKKDASASGAWNTHGIVQEAIRQIKKHFPDFLIVTDVCLCAYTDHGHCGLLNGRDDVDNDASLPVLAQTALSHAEAGADMVAPSDMMDGRVQAIRTLLDREGFVQTAIMSYAAKYASSFYGPFRDAAGSAPQGKGKIPKDRKTYQMDFCNSEEAMREIAMDIQEGADVVMVKPGLAYLDIVRRARDAFRVPLAVYMVSGEYAMIKAAAEKGWVDEKKMVIETTTAAFRAGARMVISYYAKQLARWVSGAPF